MKSLTLAAGWIFTLAWIASCSDRQEQRSEEVSSEVEQEAAEQYQEEDVKTGKAKKGVGRADDKAEDLKQASGEEGFEKD